MDSEYQLIVWAKHKSLEDNVRQGAKASGIPVDNIAFAKSLDDVKRELQAAETPIIVIDWEVGAQSVIAFFEFAKKKQARHFWQMFLIAREASEKVIALGAENGVAKVHTGDLTPTKVKLALKRIISELDDKSPMQALMKQIATQREQGNIGAVAQILEKLNSKNPGNTSVIVELGEAYCELGRWKDCYEILQPITKQTPPNIRALHTLGKAAIKLGKPEEACELLKEAKVLNPYNVDRLIALGGALLELDEVGEARENFGEAASLAPDSVEAKKGTGTCQLLDGEVNEALDLLRGNVSGRELASVFNTAAVLSMRLGRFPKGMKLYDAAQKALAGNTKVMARLFFNKGLGFYKWKKIDEAKGCFEEALKLDPKFKNARHNLAAVVKGKAKPAKAVAKPAIAVGAEETTLTDPDPVALPNYGDGVDPDLNIDFDDSMDDAFSDALADEDERI